MARWWGQVLRHAPAIWVEKGNGITGRVGAQTLSMSQLPRWKWKSEKPIAIGTHNSELTPRCGRISRGGFGTPASLAWKASSRSDARSSGTGSFSCSKPLDYTQERPKAKSCDRSAERHSCGAKALPGRDSTVPCTSPGPDVYCLHCPVLQDLARILEKRPCHALKTT